MARFFYTPKPRQFDYRPRYYDPEKEAREKRREELLGARPATEGEYVPGDMLRRRRMQRMMESEAGRRRGRKFNASFGLSVVRSLMDLMISSTLLPVAFAMVAAIFSVSIFKPFNILSRT